MERTNPVLITNRYSKATSNHNEEEKVFKSKLKERKRKLLQ